MFVFIIPSFISGATRPERLRRLRPPPRLSPCHPFAVPRETPATP
jgi:hypothetical protein